MRGVEPAPDPDVDPSVLTDRQYHALYALYIGAQRADAEWLTTVELYNHAAKYRGVTLLTSKQDASALLAEFRQKDLVAARNHNARAYENKLTAAGLDVLTERGVPERVESALTADPRTTGQEVADD